MEEREINLWDLMIDILAHYRVLIIWMLIGAVALGLYGYKKNYTDNYNAAVEAREAAREAANTEKEEAEAALEAALAAEQPLTETDIANVEYLLKYSDSLEYRKHFYDTALIYTINPQEVYRRTIAYAFTADSSNDASLCSSIGAAYRELSDQGFREYLAAKYPKKYSSLQMADMMSISVKIGSFTEDISQAGTITISVYADSKVMCNEIEKAANEYFTNELAGRISETVGEHKIESLGAADFFGYVQSIADTQENMKRDIANRTKTLNETIDGYNENAGTYYSLRVSGMTQEEARAAFDKENQEEVEVPEKTTTAEEPIEVSGSISIKYIIIGIIGFAVLYAAWRCVVYIMSNKLRGCDDLKSLYGIEKLGYTVSGKKRKGLFKKLDAAIDNLHYLNRRKFTDEETASLVAAAVKLMAAKEQTSDVICVGCDFNAHVTAVVDMIAKELKKSGVNLVTVKDVLYNAQSLDSIKDASAAIMFEQAGSVMYEEILKERDLLNRQGIKIFGAVVAE